MSKFTRVDGWAAVARTVRLGMVTPAAMEPSRIPRRVSIGLLPVRFYFALRDRITRNPINARTARILLPGGRAKAVPGVAHLMVVDLRQIVRRVERQRLDVEPADGAEQRVGGDHAIALRADQPRLRRNQILLRVQHVDRGALATGGFL